MTKTKLSRNNVALKMFGFFYRMLTKEQQEFVDIEYEKKLMEQK